MRMNFFMADGSQWHTPLSFFFVCARAAASPSEAPSPTPSLPPSASESPSPSPSGVWCCVFPVTAHALHAWSRVSLESMAQSVGSDGSPLSSTLICALPVNVHHRSSGLRLLTSSCFFPPHTLAPTMLHDGSQIFGFGCMTCFHGLRISPVPKANLKNSALGPSYWFPFSLLF